MRATGTIKCISDDCTLVTVDTEQRSRAVTNRKRGWEVNGSAPRVSCTFELCAFFCLITVADTELSLHPPLLPYNRPYSQALQSRVDWRLNTANANAEAYTALPWTSSLRSVT